jgi:hypothetical protein
MRSLLLAFFLVILAGTPFAETRVVSTTSEGKTKTVSTEVVETAMGGDLEVEEKNDEASSVTLIAGDGTVKSQEIRSKDGTMLMVSDGASVTVSGTWKGKALSGSYAQKGVGFYGNGFAFALRALARNNLKTLKFVMVRPTEPAKSTVMELIREGGDSFKGRKALKVKLTLSGAMSAFWSARLLIGEDGILLRYTGNQGPGTPNMVSELVDIKS